jgi:hypothetical protein
MVPFSKSKRRFRLEQCAIGGAVKIEVITVPVRMADRRECSDRKGVSQCRDQARWAFDGVVFEVKKEIPDGLFVLFYTRDVEPF